MLTIVGNERLDQQFISALENVLEEELKRKVLITIKQDTSLETKNESNPLRIR